MENVENLKVKLTKRLLKQALLQLLADEHTVSVKAICDRAGVHRSTFYLHYSSPQDLFDDIGTDFLKRIFVMFDAAKTLEQLHSVTLEYLRDLKREQLLARVLLVEKEGGNFRRALIPEVTKLFPVPYLPDKTQKQREYAVAFVIWGSIQLQAKWIENGFDMTEAELTDLIMSLTKSALT